MTLLLLDTVSKRFGDVTAVDQVSFRVDPGQVVGFLGPNGAGKSTTVLMLTTLLPPTSGIALVDGFDVVTQGPEVRKVIGAALRRLRSTRS
jgi:ABC-2 type transport system ATP-binding protein